MKENSRRIRATADRQQTVIIAEAQREAEILIGTGDAQRNLILGEAYGQDPEFFDFFRSLEAYADTFKSGRHYDGACAGRRFLSGTSETARAARGSSLWKTVRVNNGSCYRCCFSGSG